MVRGVGGRARALFAAYVEAKQRQNMLDYDDLLLYWAQTMGDPALAAEVGGRFDHVLVDEYQDTNRLQASILLALKPAGGASPWSATTRNRSIRSGRPPCATFSISRASSSAGARSSRWSAITARPSPSWRPPTRVIGLAARALHQESLVRADLVEQPQLVTVRDEADQARYVVEQMLEHREAGIALKQQAVLFRASHHSGPLEVELTRRNIPFVKYGGLKFLEAAHIKDMLALLRLVENPRDRVAGFRVLQLLPGIGATSAARVLDQVGGVGRSGSARSTPSRRRLAAAKDWGCFVRTRSPDRCGPHAVGRGSSRGRALWYEPHLERLHEDALSAQPDLLQLEQIAAGYASRERFLTELTLDPPDATSGQAGVPPLGRGLSRALDHPLRQGPGVAIGVRAQRR